MSTPDFSHDSSNPKGKSCPLKRKKCPGDRCALYDCRFDRCAVQIVSDKLMDIADNTNCISYK